MTGQGHAVSMPFHCSNACAMPVGEMYGYAQLLEEVFYIVLSKFTSIHESAHPLFFLFVIEILSRPPHLS